MVHNINHDIRDFIILVINRELLILVINREFIILDNSKY